MILDFSLGQVGRIGEIYLNLKAHENHKSIFTSVWKQEERKAAMHSSGQADFLIPLGKVARESAHFLVSDMIVQLDLPLCHGIFMFCHDHFVFPVK